MILITLVLLLLVGTYYLNVTGMWRRYTPTTLLLMLKDDTYGANFEEFVRRYQAGKLTSVQVQRFFEKFLHPTPNFVLIDPHPAYVPIRVD